MTGVKFRMEGVKYSNNKTEGQVDDGKQRKIPKGWEEGKKEETWKQ